MAVKEAPVRMALESGEVEIARAHESGEGAIGPDRIRELERGEPGLQAAPDVVEAEQGRRGVAGAVPAEEPGGGGNLAPPPRGERGADEGGRRREAEQDLGYGVKVVGDGSGGGGGATVDVGELCRRHRPGEASVVGWIRGWRPRCGARPPARPHGEAQDGQRNESKPTPAAAPAAGMRWRMEEGID